MILGLVPARGGSKGIKNKAIRPFCGKPLLVYSIEIGFQCNFINWVVVSTEDRTIMNMAEETPAWVIERPKNLAQDDTPMMPVLQHAIKEMGEFHGKHIDVVVLLDPTSPLRTVEDVKGAYELFKKGDCDAVVSGCVAKHHPSFNMVVPTYEGSYIRLMHYTYGQISRRQDCGIAHNLDTTVWIYSREAVMAGRRIPERTKLYLVPEERSCHLDTEFDWEIAEHLYGKNLL